jgi:hypothetical protein
LAIILRSTTTSTGKNQAVDEIAKYKEAPDRDCSLFALKICCATHKQDFVQVPNCKEERMIGSEVIFFI